MNEIKLTVGEKKQAILFLGVGLIQLKSIMSAKRFGFSVIGVDQNIKSKGKKLCNHFINTNCNNVNKIFKEIKKIKNYKIIDIWANNDVILISKNKLEKKLKIQSYLNLKEIESLLNKKLFKKKFNNSLKNYFIKDTKKFPILAKPKKGHGSKGIKLLKDKNTYSKFKNKKNYIFENFLENLQEYAVNFFYDKNKVYILNSFYRYFDHKNSFVPLGTVAIKSNGKILKFLNQIKKEIYRLKLYGKIKLDIAIYNNKLKIIEISPRFHGEIDTTYLSSINNNSLSDFYFSKLRNKNKFLVNPKNKSLCGYFNCFKKVSIFKIKKIFKEENISFIRFLKRDNYTNKNISQDKFSTESIRSYIFYKTNKLISNEKFRKISQQINNFKI